MKLVAKLSMVLLMLTAPLGWADEAKDAETVNNFRQAGTGNMIDNAYGYAVFPTIGKGGIGIGGAHGKGGVYRGGKRVGHDQHVADLLWSAVGWTVIQPGHFFPGRARVH